MPEIDGFTAPGFEAVRDAFTNNFDRHGEIGAAVAVYRHGEPVVDLWGGIADPRDDRPWHRDTAAIVYSTTKGITAACANLLVQRGELDLDAPVQEYWPEFTAPSTVRWLLTHQAGLPVLDEPVTPAQAIAWTPMIDALAPQKPVWEPGAKLGYHALTYGFLVGEVVRRVSGRTIGTYLADEIAGPLGLDLWIGLPASERHRVARLVEHPSPPVDLDALPEPVRAALEPWFDPTSLTLRAYTSISPGLDHNDPAEQAAEMPSTNGIGTARGLAGLYAALIGHRLLDADHLAAATTEQAAGVCEILRLPVRTGVGFGLPTPDAFWYTPTVFGNPGRGGSIGFADPARGLAFGYVPNNIIEGVPDPRAADLVEAVDQALR
jgi:CubicO group peptidase (beta-lactamase class C family)